jgi:hypothetical protein
MIQLFHPLMESKDSYKFLGRGSRGLDGEKLRDLQIFFQSRLIINGLRDPVNNVPYSRIRVNHPVALILEGKHETAKFAVSVSVDENQLKVSV